MTQQSNSIAERLANAHIALTNVFNNETMLTALVRYGYDSQRLQQGQALYGAALACQQQQKIAYGQLLAARETMINGEKHAYSEYMKDVKVARVALAANRSALKQLDLVARRQKNRVDWLLQAQSFYANALTNPAIQDALAVYGLHRLRLESGKNQVEAVNACYAAQIQYTGKAQAATRARDEALSALDDWMGEFRQIARLAFKGQPETFEQLQPVRRKPKAASKAADATADGTTTPEL